jgi:hypothetical protein
VAGVVLDEARGATVHAVARAGDVDAIASDPLDVVAQDLVVVAADVDPMSAGALIAGDIGVVEVNIVVPDDVGVAGYVNAIAAKSKVTIPILRTNGVARDIPLISAACYPNAIPFVLGDPVADDGGASGSSSNVDSYGGVREIQRVIGDNRVGPDDLDAIGSV